MSLTDIKNSAFKRKRLWAFLFMVAIVLLCPFRSTVVPEQKVLVVTEGWRPIPGVRVRQIWQNYSVEVVGHEEDIPTDENGRVSFPRRTVRANLLWRVVRPILNILSQGVHASFGVQTDMFPLGEVTEKPAGQKRVEAQPGDIVFRPR